MFLFRHTDARAETVSRRYLWPSSQEDDIYERLLQTCLLERRCHEYLESENIWAEHPQKGIIDRGYYTGNEETAWKARVAYQENRHEEAVALASTVLKREPDNEELLVLRAAVHAQDHHLAEAGDDLERVLTINPRNWNALGNRAHLLRQQKNLPAALDSLNRAIAINPSVAELYQERSSLLGELSEFKQALDDLDYALTELRLVSRERRAELLQLKALTLTAWGKDQEAEHVLVELEELIDVRRLRRHLEGMRAGRKTDKRA